MQFNIEIGSQFFLLQKLYGLRMTYMIPWAFSLFGFFVIVFASNEGF